MKVNNANRTPPANIQSQNRGNPIKPFDKKEDEDKG